MFEIDFLPTEKTGEGGSKSGDAICLRMTEAGSGAVRTVIDAGYGHTGDQMVDHIRKYYDSASIDLVISTYPDRSPSQMSFGLGASSGFSARPLRTKRSWLRSISPR